MGHCAQGDLASASIDGQTHILLSPKPGGKALPHGIGEQCPHPEGKGQAGGQRDPSPVCNGAGLRLQNWMTCRRRLTHPSGSQGDTEACGSQSQSHFQSHG